MFQFPGFASPAYGFSRRYRRSGGLPHSEIHGSKPARGSPWLIATCCVLHRLSVPRHPPDALQTLDLILLHAPRAGESPQRPAPPERIRFRCITDPTANRSLRSDRPVGSSSVTNSLHMSKIPYLPRQVSVFSLADISSLTLVSDLPWSPKVILRHPAALSWWRRTGSNRRPH